MSIVFTFNQLIALGIVTILAYTVGWRVKVLFAIAAIGIFLYSYSIASSNVPFSILAAVFGLITLICTFL